MNYPNTIVGLSHRAEFHKRQLKLIEEAQAVLASGKELVHQVHLQASMPGQVPIMVEGPDSAFTSNLFLAQMLWDDHNKGQSRPRLELFVQSGDIRIAIDPVDAGKSFGLDNRISEWPAPMVFGSGDKLPSAHYASSPTQRVDASALPIAH